MIRIANDPRMGYAYDFVQMKVTLTATNSPATGGTAAASATVNVAVGLAPMVTSVAELNNGTIFGTSTIRITGKGFNPSGGDLVTFTQPGQYFTYRYPGDGISEMVVPSHTSIQLNLSQLTSGTWQLRVCGTLE